MVKPPVPPEAKSLAQSESGRARAMRVARGLYVPTASALYHLMKDSPVLSRVSGPLLTAAHGALRPTLTSSDVVEVVALLEDAGVTTHLMGGWGLDALLDRAPRPHGDIDLIIPAAALEQARELLARHGFLDVPGGDVHVSTSVFPRRITVRDRSGRFLDVHLLPEPARPADARDEELPVEELDAAAITRLLWSASGLARGQLAGRPVSCPSARLQLALRLGFPPRPKDISDVAVLCQRAGLPAPPALEQAIAEAFPLRGAPGRPPLARARRRVRWLRRKPPLGRPLLDTSLIVPLPEVDEVLGGIRLAHNPSARTGVPAHVTLIYPFVSARRLAGRGLEQLEEILAPHRRFDLVLGEMGSFPTSHYLRPEPSAPFLRMTMDVWSAWPSYPPYAGAYSDVVPHVSLAVGADLPDIAEEVGRVLPIHAAAREVWVMEETPAGTWTRLHAIPLRP
ncbi:MAG: 2'-5' RNA ligase family protein [Mycobacteriales bacterium]